MVWLFRRRLSFGGIYIHLANTQYTLPRSSAGICDCCFGIFGGRHDGSLLRKEPTKSEKAAWMLAAFLLLGLEMWAVTKDRRNQDNRHLVELGQQQDRFNDTLLELGLIRAGVQRLPTIEDTLHQQGLELQRDATNLLEFQHGIADLPENSLLRRSTQLAQDMNVFPTARDMELSKLEDSLPPTDKEPAFQTSRRQTIVLFEQMFGVRCRGISQELMARGINVDILDRACKFPPGGDYLPVSQVPQILLQAVTELR